MVFGTPGGDGQAQAMLQTFLNVFVFGMNPQMAVESPRFISISFPNSFAPNEYYPGQLALERRLEDAIAEALAERGHAVAWWPEWFWRCGSVCMCVVDRATGIRHAGADPRQGSYALGW